jgi:hypothetical protein
MVGDPGPFQDAAPNSRNLLDPSNAPRIDWQQMQKDHALAARAGEPCDKRDWAI